MQTQPSGNGPNAPTPMLPVMPQAKVDIKADIKAAAPSPRKPPRTEAEAALAERAQVTRRKSLRRQRAAQKR